MKIVFTIMDTHPRKLIPDKINYLTNHKLFLHEKFCVYGIYMYMYAGFHNREKSLPPPLQTRFLFHANDTDQSYNLIITITLRMHLKCVLSL